VARYYLDKDLLIEGIVPGSVIGVWRADSEGNPDLDYQYFLGTATKDRIKIPIPAANNEVLSIRVRKFEFRPIQTEYYINGDTDGILTVQQIQDIFS
jgi:hypothetical protein